MKFSEGRGVPAESLGRVPGSIMNKITLCPDLRFLTFSKLYDSMVGSVLFYAAGVWGFEDVPECNAIQSRAMRSFLGYISVLLMWTWVGNLILLSRDVK